jgi:hypothetical protein
VAPERVHAVQAGLEVLDLTQERLLQDYQVVKNLQYVRQVQTVVAVAQAVMLDIQVLLLAMAAV